MICKHDIRTLDTIIFYFCVPHSFWKKVLATRNSNIYCLNRFLDQEHVYVFIYSGSIIDPDLTFRSIGILEEEPIIAIKKNIYQSNSIDINSKWMRLSCDHNFKNKLRIMSNRHSKSEYNRIEDIKNLKIEGNHRLYKKQAHRIFLKEPSENDSSSKLDYSKIDYKPLQGPSEDALPFPWQML